MKLQMIMILVALSSGVEADVTYQYKCAKGLKLEVWKAGLTEVHMRTNLDNKWKGVKERQTSYTGEGMFMDKRLDILHYNNAQYQCRFEGLDFKRR